MEDWEAGEVFRRELGAEVTVEWPRPRSRSGVEQGKLRGRARVLVNGCWRCGLGPGLEGSAATRHVPLDRVELGGDPSLEVLVVGEGPGAEEDARGVGFIGPSGRLLRALMTEAGIGTAWMMNVVACRPPGNRAPRPEEIQACATNVQAQAYAAAVSGVRHAFMVGATATGTWRPDLKVTQHCGVLGMWTVRAGGERSGFLTMPLVHPAGVLRNPALKGLVRMAIVKMAEVMRDGGVGDLGAACLRCGRVATQTDRDGMGWCDEHAERYRPPGRKRPGQRGQETLEGLDDGDEPGVDGRGHGHTPTG